jgi:hypothetical protein
MKYKRYTTEDFKNMRNGYYLLFFPKLTTLSTKGIYIFEGVCVNESFTTINPKLKKLCFLQMYREITEDEEEKIWNLFEKKNFKVPTKLSEKEVLKTIQRPKKTEEQMRREYYENFDKKLQEKYRRDPKKVFNPGPTAIKTLSGKIIA